MANQQHRNPSDPVPSHPSHPTGPAGPDRPGPEEAVFRETFVIQLTRRRDNDAVRACGDLLAEMIRDYEGSEPEVGESWYYREMRAGAADLGLLERYFRAFHEQRYGNSMTADEGDLCDLGRQLAGEIDRLAERVEDAVGPVPQR